MEAYSDNLDIKTLHFKVLVLGDTNVGKTCLSQRFTGGTFSTEYKATIGSDFACVTIKWNPNLEIRLQLWDTGGQERFSAVTRAHFRGTDGVFCVLDMTNPLSMERCNYWRREAFEKCTNTSGDLNYPPVICLGNKYDLISETGELTEQEEVFAHSCKVADYQDGILVSAKTNLNVQKALQSLIACMIEKRLKDEADGNLPEKDETVFKLGESSSSTDKSSYSYVSSYFGGWTKC